MESNLYYPGHLNELQTWLNQKGNLIARGNGRCYGDAALAHNTVSTLSLNQILDFDIENGIITCQAGVLLADILQLVVPKGFFLSVSPGTKFITVGGAIAADIHGKNHHKEGSFSDFLESFRLIQADEKVVECSKVKNPALFWATCGGMGLTGIIITATFRLRKVQTAFIKQTSYKTKTLSETLEKIDNAVDDTYSVAWIDCMAKGEKLGRGLLLNGEHASVEELPEQYTASPLLFRKKKAISVPFFLPGMLLNSFSIKTFNFLYYQRQRADIQQSFVHYEPYFYPLDSLLHWNRIYGKKGFTQYQCVLPQSEGKKGISELLSKIRDSGFGSFLTVLKLMGPGHNQSPLAFPMQGYTLALDFKITKGLFAMLDALDRIVLEYGGRLYLAKDARMASTVFKQTYTQSSSFRNRFMTKENKLYSALAQRLEL
ncbi:MAG: FAD-binding oxidoreductase [Bacteroidota bacterium]